MDEIDTDEIAIDRQRAEVALDVVRLDVAATLTEAVNLHIAASGGTMWVTDDEGSSYGETFSHLNGARMLAAVADGAQTVVIELVQRIWPECPAHHVGLHVATHSDRAVWECRSGGHVAAAVGHLTADITERQ